MFGFAEQDILFYLNPSDLVPGLTVWAAARKDWRKYQVAAGSWISRVAQTRTRCRIGAFQIRSAARRLDQIPNEFKELADLVASTF